MATNAEVVRAIEEAWDGGQARRAGPVLRRWLQQRAVGHARSARRPGGREDGAPGRDAVLPDRKVEILDIVEGGDRVFVRNRVTGTNTGGFPPFGVPANGNAFDIESWSVYRFDDGKVVEHWGINDAFTLGMQLGAIPTPGG